MLTTSVRAAVWAAAWAIGAGLGIALGAYLTATSGIGAPGASALDTTDLLRLPASGAAIVFAVCFVIGWLRIARKRMP